MKITCKDKRVFKDMKEKCINIRCSDCMFQQVDCCIGLQNAQIDKEPDGSYSIEFGE